MPHSVASPSPSPSSLPASWPQPPSLSGHLDHEVPWGMQIAVRYDKVHPPRRIDVAEAAARAVVALLAAPASAPGGPWNQAVDYWRDGRIRKLVRRARGKRWDEVQDIDGVTVTQDGPVGWGRAAARAFVPGPVRPLPGALAKTQVEGTHFPSGDELPPPPAAITARVAKDPAAASEIALTAASASTGSLVTIEATPLHEMTSGKLAAQCAHAAQLAWESPAMPSAVRRAWAEDGYRVRVVVPSREQWASTTRPVHVTDAGFTELDGPTETTRAFW
ncbi:peptidyl-tRNA hydrolase [Actinomyces sp. ZJ308]|uniref:peptidyl-tRNA hydrolase n=1 Tax=Actinomyces sp. ZJ308 TaxID=2708342 RepID=UPI001FB967F0|nr:peptidyl-tRNA hydrolase [Actinomyces sp. ZJ308]